MNDFNVWCEVVCSGCSETLEGSFYRKGTVSRLREKAKKEGWKIVDGRTLCPRCAEKHKRKE